MSRSQGLHTLAAPTSSVARLLAQSSLILEGAALLLPLRRWWLGSFGGMWLVWITVTATLFAGNARGWWDGDSFCAAAATSGLAGAGSYGFYRYRKYRYASQFDDWRDQAVRSLGATRLAAKSWIPREQFESADLQWPSFNTYAGSDLVECDSFAACNLEVVQISTETYSENVPTTRSDGTTSFESASRTRTQRTEVFQGVFLVIRVPTKSPGDVVLNDPQRGIGRRKAFRVASPELNRMYCLGAVDPFLGHRLLSPAFQASLLDFTRRFPQPPSICFREDAIYVAFPGIKLDMGQTLGWRAPSPDRLGDVINRCGETLAWLRECAARLHPQS